MDPTCDPRLRSFLDVAPESHFPIQNLPLGVFRSGKRDEPRIGVAIGDWVLDLGVLAKERLFNGLPIAGDFFLWQHNLNALLAMGRAAWSQVRQRLSQLLRHDEAALRDNVSLRNRALLTAQVGADAVAGAHRKLHRFLLVARTCHATSAACSVGRRTP